MILKFNIWDRVSLVLHEKILTILAHIAADDKAHLKTPLSNPVPSCRNLHQILALGLYPVRMSRKHLSLKHQNLFILSFKLHWHLDLNKRLLCSDWEIWIVPTLLCNSSSLFLGSTIRGPARPMDLCVPRWEWYQ